MFNVFQKRSSQGHRRRRRSNRLHERTLHYEVLEVRIVPSSTYTWTGGGANNNWSTGANWQGAVAPTSGSILVFGSGESRLTNVDDMPGLSVAEIELAGGYSISGDAITLTGSAGVGIDNQSGTNSFNNPITLGADLTFTEDAGQLTLGGVVTGSQSLTTNGAGTLVLGGTNSYGGDTIVSAGTLQDGIANALPTTTTLTVNGTGAFDLGGFAQMVAGLADGGVSTGTVTDSSATATLTVNDAAADTFSGSIGGALALIKSGAGTLTLSNTNAYTGATIVNSGVLLVNGLQSGSAVTVNSGAILGGTNGTVGNISVLGGTVSPGAASAGSGILNSGTVNLSSTAAFNVDLNGTLVGTGFDQLNATGAVTIDPSTALNVTLGTGFTPTIGNTFPIIQSPNAISGTFASLPEGATYSVGGQFFQVSYKNDNVTLTCVAATTTTVSSSLNPSIYGQSAIFTATVDNTSASGGVPSGSVTFFDGSNVLGPGTTLSGAATSATSTFSVSTLTAGAHSISAVYVATGNFLGSTSSTLSQTVNKAPLTITASDQTKVYGAAQPTLTASYSGFVNGETSASLTTQPTLTTTATASSHVGTYSITANGAVDSNYSITYVAGSLSVTTAPLTITANNQTKAYGAALPALTASYSGFVNGDSSASLTTQPTLTTTATASSHVSGSPYSITASGAVDSDYSITYSAGTLTVTPVVLTITASNKTKSYGASLPTLTASYSGFVNGDSSSNLTTQPSLTTTATASSHVSGNPYTISASGAVDSDYSITYVAGTLTVNPVVLTITASNQTKAYGAALPTLTVSYTGFVNGDNSASLTTQPTLTTTATAGSHVSGSPYTITASGAADSDYSISYVPGTLSVTPVALVITASNQNKVYGAVLPQLTASYSGLVNGDTSASLTTQPTLSTTATASSHVSGNPYSITASGAADTDYTISYVSGTLTVTPAALTITANNQTKAYGAGMPTLTASYAGLVNGDTVSSLTILPVLTTTATASSHVSGNPYSITVGGAADIDYSLSYVSGTLTITPVSLTITAINKTKAYGSALPTLTVTYSGLVNGDTAATFSTGANTPPTISTVSANSHAGSYAITASAASDVDYAISYVTGTLTVTPVVLVITADNQSKLYGAALPSLTASYSGFVNGDTSASLTTLPALSTTATASSHVSGNPYTITASGAVDSDYSISYVPGTLTVTPATLVITAVNLAKAYGAAVPTLSATYSGFVNGDTGANLTTQPVLSTTATAHSPVSSGPYNITASGASDSDYTISYVFGALTVTPASLTITADNQTKVYGAAMPTLTASYTGLVNGDTAATFSQAPNTAPSIVSTATARSHVAGSPYAITASGAADSNYSISYVSGTLTVTPAALTITAANKAKVYGAALPALTASYSGFVNGDTSGSLTTQPTLSTTATASSHVSGNPYPITASGAVDSDYSISYASGSLTVTHAALTITPDNQTKVYGAALPTLTATFSGFVNGDTPTSLTTQPSLTTTALTSSHVAGSPYSITASGAADSDYSISYAVGTLTITPVALTIAANNQSKVYGAVLPTLTVSYTGLVNGDTAASLTIQPALTTTATNGSHVSGSPYSVTASGAVDADYSISYVGGTLTVTPSALTITANNQNMVVNTSLPTLTASYTGLVNGDTAASLTTQPTLTTTATSGSPISGNPYPITVSGAVDADYGISYVNGTLTVINQPTTTVTLTVSPGSTSTYGQDVTVTATVTPTDPHGPTASGTVQFEVDGVFFGSAVQLANGSATIDLLTSLKAGAHTITAIFSGDQHYASNSQWSTQTVTPAALTITTLNNTKVYGAALPTFSATYSGFVNGDTGANLTTQPVLSTTATAHSPVSSGPYSITASGAADSNYTISYVSGTLTVTPAALTITADNQTKIYGAAMPTLTASYAGLVNGDTAATFSNAPNTAPSIVSTATASSHVAGSPYAITASGAVDSNYSISYVFGTLTVTPAALTITANNQSKVYGAALPTLTASYTGLENGDTSASLTTQPMLRARKKITLTHNARCAILPA